MHNLLRPPMKPGDVRSEYLKRRRKLLKQAFSEGDFERAADIVKETMRGLGDTDRSILRQRAQNIRTSIENQTKGKQ